MGMLPQDKFQHPCTLTRLATSAFLCFRLYSTMSYYYASRLAGVTSPAQTTAHGAEHGGGAHRPGSLRGALTQVSLDQMPGPGSIQCHFCSNARITAENNQDLVDDCNVAKSSMTLNSRLNCVSNTFQPIVTIVIVMHAVHTTS